MRTYLQNSSILEVQAQGSTKSYIIDNYIAEGANCIVYDAHCYENEQATRRVRIKEYFPSINGITRSGNSIQWTKNTEQLKNKFKEDYLKQIALQNNENFSNSSAHIVDSLYEGNNTLYIIVAVDHGWTFDQDAKYTDKISDVLKSMIALSKVIKKYHDNGLLHLDIKPQNFLILPETRELVKLIDADTIVEKKNIINGNVNVVPYSIGWAAPEQVQGKVKRISEQTDIFSLGAVLFYRIMGKGVTSDDISVFTEYSFQNTEFRECNDELKECIRMIFKKTLSASPKKRYPSVDLLISDLENALKISQKKYYLQDNCPESNIHFVGREDELNEIHNHFQSGKRILFLQGMGGVGKSELAIKYAELFKKEYDHTIFLRYHDSIEKLLKDVPISGYEFVKKEVTERQENSEYQEKLSAIRDCSNGKQVLFIIDNFDVEPGLETKLEDLTNLGVNLIITTRCDYEQYYDNKAAHVHIDTLDMEQAVRVFLHNYKGNISGQDVNKIQEILKRIDNYTLLITVVARYIYESGMTISEFAKKFDEESVSGYDEDSEKVKIVKDGVIITNTMMGHVRTVFNIMGLQEEHKQVLINMYYLNIYAYPDKKLYRKITGSHNLNALNYLISVGMIQKKEQLNNGEEYLAIHQVFLDLIKTDIQPTPEKAVDIQKYISNSFQQLSGLSTKEDTREVYKLLALYIQFVAFDNERDEKLVILASLLERLFEAGETDIISHIFKEPSYRDFVKRTANPSYFIRYIYIICFHNSCKISEDHEVKEINFAPMVTGMVSIIEEIKYEINKNDVNNDLFEDLLCLIRVCICLIEFKMEEDGCNDNKDIVEQLSIDKDLIKITKILTVFFQFDLLSQELPRYIKSLNSKYSYLYDEKLNSRASYYIYFCNNKLCEILERFPVLLEVYRELYLYATKMNDINSSVKENKMEIQELQQLIYFELSYAKGEFLNPYVDQDMTLEKLEINDFPNHRDRNKSLAETFINEMLNASDEQRLAFIELCLNKDFLLAQPIVIRNSLSRNQWLQTYCEGKVLSDADKKTIIDVWSDNLSSLFSLRICKIKNSQKYNIKIVQVYASLVPLILSINDMFVGSYFTLQRVKVYSSLCILSKWSKIELSYVANLLSKEIVYDNIDYFDNILVCIRKLSSNGNKKLAYKLKEELLSWYDKDLSSIKDGEEIIFTTLRMAISFQRLAKEMKNEDLYNRMTTEIATASIESLDIVRWEDEVPGLGKKAASLMAQKIVNWAADIIGTTTVAKDVKKVLKEDNEFFSVFMECTQSLDFPWILFNKTVSAEVAVAMKLSLYIKEDEDEEFCYGYREVYKYWPARYVYKSKKNETKQIEVGLLHLFGVLYGKEGVEYVLSKEEMQLEQNDPIMYENLINYAEE